MILARKFFLFLFFFASFAQAQIAQPRRAPFQSRIPAEWELQGDSIVSVGGDATRLPQTGKAVLLSGSTTFVQIPSFSGIQFALNQAWSISFWYKTTTTNVTESILANRGSSNSQPGINISHSNGTLSCIIQQVYNTQYLIATMSTVPLGGSTFNYNISSGRWNHIVVTYDGSGTAAGINFYNMAYPTNKTTGGAGTLTTCTSLLAWQTSLGGAAQSAGGSIFDVRFFNRVVTASEVTSIYKGETITSGCQLQMLCDEGAGTLLNYSITSNDKYKAAGIVGTGSSWTTNPWISWQNQSGYSPYSSLARIDLSGANYITANTALSSPIAKFSMAWRVSNLPALVEGQSLLFFQYRDASLNAGRDIIYLSLYKLSGVDYIRLVMRGSSNVVYDLHSSAIADITLVNYIAFVWDKAANTQKIYVDSGSPTTLTQSISAQTFSSGKMTIAGADLTQAAVSVASMRVSDIYVNNGNAWTDAEVGNIRTNSLSGITITSQYSETGISGTTLTDSKGVCNGTMVSFPVSGVLFPKNYALSTTTDVNGNSLTYVGRVKYPVTRSGSPGSYTYNFNPYSAPIVRANSPNYSFTSSSFPALPQPPSAYTIGGAGFCYGELTNPIFVNRKFSGREKYLAYNDELTFDERGPVCNYIAATTELILLDGQSNASGSENLASSMTGSYTGTPSNEFVWRLNSPLFTNFVALSAGSGGSNEGSQVGPEMSMMYDLQASKNDVLYMMKYTQGSTALAPPGNTGVYYWFPTKISTAGLSTVTVSGATNYSAGVAGQYYVISGTGSIGGSGGLSVTTGDQLYCLITNAGGTQAAVGTSWYVLPLSSALMCCILL